MNRFILFLAGGYGFFAGLLLLSVAFGLASRPSNWKRIFATLSALIGVILIVVSTTPISLVWYGLLCISVMLWIVSIRTDKLSQRGKFLAARLMILTVASGLILEIPYILSPRISPPAHRRLVILADSITAGVRDDEQTWPMRLRQIVDYEIIDLSHVGAKVADGPEMLAAESVDGELVLIELGGNDLLGNTPPDEFHLELEKVLQRLSAADCTIAMFELPLPPFYYQYGYSQRELAARYHVALIPKRCLLDVLVGEEKTLDSIHLSDTGHQQMAELMEKLLAPAMDGN